MMDDWELWIWRGIRLELPADWEMLQFQRDPERGRCSFADAFQMRAELSWRRLSPKEPGGEPHPLKMRDDYIAWLKTAGVQQIRPSAATGAAGTMGWLGARGIAYGQAFSNHSRWFGKAGLLLELFLWRPDEDAALESRALASCRPVAADGADAGRWRAFGLDVRTELPLQRCEAFPGLARMAFARKDDPEPFFVGRGGGGERLLVERRGLARHWLAEDTLLATWNRAQVPTGLRRDGGEFASTDERVTCAWIAGIPRRSPVVALAQNVKALVLRRARPRPAFLSIACAIPARNELRRAEFWTTLGPPGPEAAARQILPAPAYRKAALPILPPAPRITPDPECALPPPANWTALLGALPIRNAAAEIEPSGGSGPGLHLRLRNARPAWYRPPLSWVLPRRPYRRFSLDELGAALWRRCDGQTPVLDIITDFAHAHQTTFHEARVVVSQHLQTLTARGLIAIASEQP